MCEDRLQRRHLACYLLDQWFNSGQIGRLTIYSPEDGSSRTTCNDVFRGFCNICSASRWFRSDDRDMVCEFCSDIQYIPDDYEVCGTCGYDHAYDCIGAQAEIERLHKEAERG